MMAAKKKAAAVVARRNKLNAAKKAALQMATGKAVASQKAAALRAANIRATAAKRYSVPVFNPAINPAIGMILPSYLGGQRLTAVKRDQVEGSSLHSNNAPDIKGNSTPTLSTNGTNVVKRDEINQPKWSTTLKADYELGLTLKSFEKAKIKRTVTNEEEHVGREVNDGVSKSISHVRKILQKT